MTTKKTRTKSKRRITPEDDFERLAERINTQYGRKIEDKETFDKAFDLYIGDDLTNKQETELRNKTFAYYRKLNPNVKAESIFRKAGGKQFTKDKKTRAKRVVKTEREYKKLGASRVDLEGYDTPSRRNVIYTFVTVRGKQQRRARNPKTGRFERLR